MNFLYYFVVLVVSYFVGQALAPKPQAPKPAAFEDVDVPQFEEGTPQEVIFGDCWTQSWMVLGLGNFRSEPIKKKGGKK